MASNACRALLMFASLAVVAATAGVSTQPAGRAGEWTTYVGELVAYRLAGS
jgi:hypothetical protein